MIINTIDKISNNSLEENLIRYFNNKLLDDIYFKPKKVDKKLVNEKIKEKEYINKIEKTLDSLCNINIVDKIENKIKEFENMTEYKLDEYKIYLIIGLNTTTIYSTKYNNEDITVLLLEPTEGIEENLNMLLAHEFTHFVRKQFFKRDIFENSIGERFIVEGIGCNFSREIVPGKKDYEYCIVDEKTVEWVKNNLVKIEEHIGDNIDTNKLMYDFFYMYSDFEKTKIMPRSGYVYGYLKIKKYLEDNNKTIKDIITMNWKKLI